MEAFVRTLRSCRLVIGYLLLAGSLQSQQSLVSQNIPSSFRLDTETAARLRPQLWAQSEVPAGRYAVGKLVLERLAAQASGVQSTRHIEWQLRIIDDPELNAYSSPDGSIYIERGLADLAGGSAGLWAAILSHEVAHVVRRDWARRYLYRQSIESEGGASVILGDPGLPSSSWTDSTKASAELGQFCRQLELEADRLSLMLMSRAGYHPDFVPALHHLLHAHEPGPANASVSAMHPCWEERDRQLAKAYVDASIEFEHRWPEWYASPGGNPPVVVFAEPPTVKRTGSKEWEIRFPLRCQNLAGAVEVLVLSDSGRVNRLQLSGQPGTIESGRELRQLTGCTSPITTVTFTFGEGDATAASRAHWTDVYVLDAWGSVLARADLPKLPR